MRRLLELLEQIPEDPWRRREGFSPDIQEANQVLFDADCDKTRIESELNRWLSRFQPCLFGRLAAKRESLSFCVLNEADLEVSDEHVRDKIQSDRLSWTKRGFEGVSSGFVIILVSPRIAHGMPGEATQQLAYHLGFLYLGEDIEPDKVHLDEVYLQTPTREDATWLWKTGVNYFCAQGDRRWWQDHRIPGGIAFSVNSVGHMVKSGKLALGLRELRRALDLPNENFANPIIDSLPKALEFAMRTIDQAADGISGKATTLIPLSSEKESEVRCPVSLPDFLKDKSHCSYRGYYHTDYTVPSEYFVPDVERPEATKTHELDFTYLFDESLDNPDFLTMGEGRRIRADVPAEYRFAKRLRGIETEAEIDDLPRLREALGR